MRNRQIDHARSYATERHVRIAQRRRASPVPHPEHLKAVVELVAGVTDDPETIAAAWLHDIVEDTSVTFEELEREFGTGVTQLVREQTLTGRGAGHRARREEADRRLLAAASPRAQTIRLAAVVATAREIARKRPRSARADLVALSATFDSLRAGAPKLREKALAALDAASRQLGIALPAPRRPQADDGEADPMEGLFAQLRGMRHYTGTFTARDLLEPLRSFDAGSGPAALRDAFARCGDPVAGIRRDGRVEGFLLPADLAGRRDLPPARPFSEGQLVELETPLAEVIDALTYHDQVFVRLAGGIVGVIGRADIEKPVVRMWLFGLVLLIDLAATDAIRREWPGDAWASLVPAPRLAKASALRDERQRRGLAPTRLECLQFADKLELLFRLPGFVEGLGFASNLAAKRVVSDLESLRNDLAHGQPITPGNWPAIARLARQLGAVADPGR